MLRLSRLLIGGLAITLLSACGYDHTVIGKIEEDLLITKEEIHAMGFEQFKEQYLGKVITITDLDPLGRGGGFNLEKGQCKIAFSNTAELIDDRWHNPYPIGFSIYANKTPSYAIKKSLIEGSYTEESLEYEDEINLPLSVCTPCKEWDPKTKSCFYRSPHIIVTGKIIQTGQTNNSIGMIIRPSGFAY